MLVTNRVLFKVTRVLYDIPVVIKTHVLEMISSENAVADTVN